jgi:hypothetical protein
MDRLDKRGRRIGFNWWREQIVESWSGANELWLAKREDEAIGYATEEREFAESNPRPTLKWFMISMRFREQE